MLAVLQADNDIINQMNIQLVRKYDPERQRTTRIITKLDVVNKGSEASLFTLANDESNVKLKLGFFLIKKPEPLKVKSGITSENRLQNGLMFFSQPR